MIAADGAARVLGRWNDETGRQASSDFWLPRVSDPSHNLKNQASC